MMPQLSVGSNPQMKKAYATSRTACKLQALKNNRQAIFFSQAMEKLGLEDRWTKIVW